MPKARAKESIVDQLVEQNITHEEVYAAARRAFDYLTACIDGEIEDAKVVDKIWAARTLLEHSYRMPDLLGDIAGLASEDDVSMIASAVLE
jgi:hypothetical protein